MKKFLNLIWLFAAAVYGESDEDFNLNTPTTVKTLFVIPCNFTDEVAGTTITQLNQMAQYMATTFYNSSYGHVSFTYTVPPHYYNLPHPTIYYGDWHNRQLISADALAAVQNDYGDVIHNYDHVVFFFPPIPHWGFGAFSDGNLGIWINGGGNTFLLCHEMGHQFFLGHAQKWAPCNLANPVDHCGHIVGQGDCNDIMIDRIPQGRDFNAYERYIMGWINPTQVRNVTATGTYRIHRCDSFNSGGFHLLALSFPQPGTSRTYFISYRYTPDALRNGAFVSWAASGVSILIDYTPLTGSCDNAMVPVGATLNDNGVTITPIRLGGTDPDRWIDVRVTL
jgi:hypothetical protein